MAFGFFKDGDELYDEGEDLIKRREYDKAAKSFDKCLDKDKCTKKDMARLMLSILNIRTNINSPGAYLSTAELLRGQGDLSFEFGLTQMSAPAVVAECEATAKMLTAQQMPSNNNTYEAKGQVLISAAQEMQTKVGNANLVFYELFRNTQMTGMRLSALLMATGFESMSEGHVWADPKKAAEYLQMAHNYRRQFGETGEENLDKIKKYSKSCTCWICGRETSGEGVHFFAMPSEISPQLRNAGDSPLASANESYDSIFACRACYSAISKRADSIAQYYHNKSMAEIARVRAELLASIAALESQIAYLRMTR